MMERLMRNPHRTLQFDESMDQSGGMRPLAQRRIPDKRNRKPIEDHNDWIALMRTEDGHLEMRSSVSMKPYRQEIMQEATRKFYGICKARNTDEGTQPAHRLKETRDSAYPTSPGWHDHIPPHMHDHMSLSSLTSNPKRRRLEHQLPAEPSSDFNAHLPAVETQMSQVEPHSTLISDESPNEPPSRPMLSIRVDQPDIFKEWLRNAFKAIQQQSCRLIAKEWIKLIHPKKQSTHPYNGNYPKNTGGPFSPDRTKPPYWPPHIKHKEPDHIDKDGLLVHLIMNTPQKEITPANPDGKLAGREIKAEELLETLAQKKREELKDKWEIIAAIVEARTKFESFEEGGSDASTQVHVVNYQEVPRPGANSRRQRARSVGNVEEMARKASSAEDASRPPSPMPTDLPTDSPTDSSTTTAESSNDDVTSAITTSFSSAVTAHPPSPLKAKIRPKRERPLSHHQYLCTESPQQEVRGPFEGELYANLDFSHHQPIHSMVQDGWPSTTTATLGLDGHYTSSMLVSHNSSLHCDPRLFTAACNPVLGTNVPVISYNPPPPHGFDYCNNLYQDVPFRSMAGINQEIDQGMDAMEGFSMQEHYYHMLGQPRSAGL